MNSGEYHVSFGVKLRRAILTRSVRILFQLLGRVKVTGLEYIPRATSYVVAANHVSIYDPPLILCLWPEMLEAIGAVNVFDKPIQGEMLRLYGTIPVHRGEFDRELIEKMLAILRSGHRLMIAPEGGRSHATAMRRAMPGVGYILDEARVPVIPVGIVGTTDDFLKNGLKGKRPMLEMHVGKPITLPPIDGKGEERRA
ncbi:MAG TPA: lysophospholipid acyltransferase family protein, partial [Anaerolineales bacterium]|nr:lysophospholipid acyltransferase family protein [Anaerolineales bacterium]